VTWRRPESGSCATPNEPASNIESDAALPYNFSPPPTWRALVATQTQGQDGGVPHYAADVGCGPGQFLPELHDVIGGDVIGLDISAHMLRTARDRFGCQFALVQANACGLPLKPGSCGLVLHRYLLHHLRAPQDAVAEASRVLARGGYLVVESSNPEWLRDRPEYRDFPRVAMIDLSRWPPIQRIIRWMRDARLDFSSHIEVHLTRDVVTKAVYLARLDTWMKVGGGTSFWQFFNATERSQFVGAEVGRLKNTSDRTLIPIPSDGMLLVGRKF
jgi:ubiquinone/menaquinone biosynthesis C-methylase UbiE